MRPCLGSRSEWEQDGVSEGPTFALGTEEGYNGYRLFDRIGCWEPDCAGYATDASRPKRNQISFSPELNCQYKKGGRFHDPGQEARLRGAARR